MPDSTPTLARTARASSDACAMLPPGGVVIAMLSGGGDSVALLRLLTAGDLGDGLTLAALHVNHLLRGDESDADQEFCEELCARLGVELFVHRVDVAARAKDDRLNLEDAGRQIRYQIAATRLEELCAREDVASERGRIAVAHTRDDRVETALMRLAQGAGATGLTSLRPVRGRIVRPLIDCSREDVRAYLDSLGQEWREDATNTDTDRLRAKVRAELVPVMRDINPRFDESLVRSLGLLSDEDDMIAEMAQAFTDDWIEVTEGEIAFDRAMLATLSRPMLRRTLREALTRAFPELSRIDFEHVEAVAEGATIDGFTHDLPGGIRAFDEYGRMVVSRTGGAQLHITSSRLSVPGTVNLGDGGKIIAEETSPTHGDGGRTSIVVDADKIAEWLEVGQASEGERMRPLGMEGTKKLSDLFVDEKVPRRARSATPVVRDAGGVVWLAGVRMSELHKVDEKTTRAVALRWEPSTTKGTQDDDER